MSDPDYRNTLVAAFDANRDTRTLRKISNFWLNKSKAVVKREKQEAEAAVDGVETRRMT